MMFRRKYWHGIVHRLLFFRSAFSSVQLLNRLKQQIMTNSLRLNFFFILYVFVVYIRYGISTWAAINEVRPS